MTAERIKTLYEECQLTVEEIAAQENVETAFVKASLGQTSKLYNQQLKNGEEPEITDAEYRMYLNAYKGLAMSGCEDNVNVKERALRYLIEEKKGRNEARVKNISRDGPMQQNNYNVLVLQDALDKSKQIKARLKQPKTQSPAPVKNLQEIDV